MQIIDKIQSLTSKYGQNFDWQEIKDKNNWFLQELISELNESHVLFEKPKEVVARRFSQDDILCLLNDNTYAIIHLTYSKNNAKGSPKFIVFDSLQSALCYIEDEYISEYIHQLEPHQKDK